MKGFRVGLGVSGGIAAYKAVEVMRLLQKNGCQVSVAMTKHATEFVRPLTFRALTDKHVIVDDYDPANPDPIAHINFSQSIDLLLVRDPKYDLSADTISQVPLAARPVMGGEDFAYYLEQVPGCFFMLGVQPPDRPDYPGLHTDCYDFTDAALSVGIRMYVELAMGYAR